MPRDPDLLALYFPSAEADADSEADPNFGLGLTHTDVNTLLREETADEQLARWCATVAEALWP